MATFLYLCEIDNQEFEEEHSIHIELEECSLCKEKKLPAHKPKKLINCMSRGVVELTGQELVDRTKEDVKKLKQEMHSNTNTYANMLGEDKYQVAQQNIDKYKRR